MLSGLLALIAYLVFSLLSISFVSKCQLSKKLAQLMSDLYSQKRLNPYPTPILLIYFAILSKVSRLHKRERRFYLKTSTTAINSNTCIKFLNF